MALMYHAPQVVVIDDDVSILSVVCELLADANITAESCPSGAYAYKYILHRRPRVVILDVRMPGVNGIEVFHQLRSEPFMDHTTVIFFTADIAYLHKHFPDYAAHGTSLLPKPLDGTMLLTLVSQALGIELDQPLEREIGECDKAC